MASEMGFLFAGTKFAGALPCLNTMASHEGARPMLNSNRQSEMWSPAANASQDLEAIVTWLRRLSGAEITELVEALANHDAETLARFDIRFQACPKRSG